MAKKVEKSKKKGEPVKALSTHNQKSLREKIDDVKPKKKARELNNDEVEKLKAKKKAPKQAIKQDEVEEDFEEKEEATEDQLQQIKKEANRAVAIAKQIEDLEAAIGTLKGEQDGILNKTLPSLLDSAGMIDFTLDDGSSIEIKDVVSGSLPSADKKPEERSKALKWLMANGGRGLIKTSFLTEFGVGQERMATFFKQLIVKNKYVAKETVGVHPQTLCAFVREKLENGEQVPTEMLGVYTGRHAKIKLSTEAQEKAEASRVKPKTRRA